MCLVNAALMLIGSVIGQSVVQMLNLNSSALCFVIVRNTSEIYVNLYHTSQKISILVNRHETNSENESVCTHKTGGDWEVCFCPSGWINWQIDDALNQCSSKAAYPMEPISGLR